ncbi:MAG: Flp pilus assembly complex ATPase component TadA [Gammaproteobacteria bacterium]|nr:Flp pilus assembly complex ATPase component TadA [Gammaproteobacteria bacterium]
MNGRKKVRLGDLLVEGKIISQEQLAVALDEQKRSGRKLGRILVENGVVQEDQVLDVLSRQLKIPYIDLKHYKFNPDVVKLLPEMLARRFRSIVLAKTPDGFLVGMADPTDIFAFDELSRALAGTVRQAVIRESDLLRTLDLVYRKTEVITEFAGELSTEMSAGEVDLRALLSDANVSDAPVVKLLQSLFEDAVQINASDIHIEPEEKLLRIRQRVDGELQEHVMEEPNIASALVSRLKLIAGLDISEKRLPQDGRFSIKAQTHNVDVRISTMPVQYGESVVMRLLDQTKGTYNLEELGMPDHLIKTFRKVISRPYGMVLVTGPTGSGKTTTLYAGLKLLNEPDTKIITVEDPVEYRLPRLNQVQVNPDIGLSFARVLRSALRHDPDIVFVGEIRDEETAEIAVRAALTGHLVLSTLHTNSAIATVNRMLDMKIPGYLLASALNAIVAQRLVRRVCESCAQNAQLTDELIQFVRHVGGEPASKAGFKKGAGCAHCNFSGFRGRLGVYELLELDRKMSAALGRGDTVEFGNLARSKPGFFTLEQAALQAAMKGITTIEEVLRISADLEGEIPEDMHTEADAASAGAP